MIIKTIKIKAAINVTRTLNENPAFLIKLASPVSNLYEFGI
jgi:hypothetical protein